MKFKDFNEEKLNIIEKSINEGLNVLEFAKPELSAEELRFEYIIRVLAKHRDYTAFSIMEDIALGVCGYDFDQLKELSNAYRLKLDMNILKDVRYSGKQMKEIRIAIQKGENYNLITSYRMDHKQMHRIRMNMKEGAFTERQLEVIRKGKEEGYDISIYAKPDFSYSKMRYILTDLRAGRDLKYLDGNYSYAHIKLIRKAMIDGKDPKPLYNPKLHISKVKQLFKGLKKIK